MEYVATGFIDGGKLNVRNRKAFENAMAGWKDGEVLVTIEKAHATRSHQQNSLYWAGYVNPLAEYTGNSPKWMHAYLKSRFLPKQRIEIVDRKTGAVVDEADLAQLTTTLLNKNEFSDYLREIQEFAQELGVHVGSSRKDDAA